MAPLPVEGAPGAFELGVAVVSGVAPVPVEGATGAFEVEAGAGEFGEKEGAVVSVDGVPGAGDLALGEGTDGAEGSGMPGHLPHVI